MTVVQAILAHLLGFESVPDRPAKLRGSPYCLQLFYLRGHPGIWEAESFWVGRVAGHLRMVDLPGQRCYDMDVNRILGITCSLDGHLFVRYEPTPGLITAVEFQAAPGSADCYTKLLDLLSLTA